MNAISLPVFKFTYAYDCPGSILDGETLDVDATTEAAAHSIVRAKLNRNGMQSIKLRLVSCEPTGMKRSA